MYCENCGAKIDDDAAFCPSCGTRVVNNPVPDKRPDHKKRIAAIAVGLTSLILVVLAGVFLISRFGKNASDKQLLYAVNNCQNGGIVATDGKWLYYEDNGLCRMQLSDGKKQSVIDSSIYPFKMICVGNNLYYYNFPSLYKVDLNKKRNEEISTGLVFEDCFQTDGKTYYFAANSEDYSSVFSTVHEDFSNLKKLSDIDPTRILMYRDSLYIMSGYTSINGEVNKNYGTWKIKKNGGKRLSLTANCPDYMVFSKDRIYFTEEGGGTICSMTLDGDDPVVYEGKVTEEGLNVSDDYIFYLKENDDYTVTIHRMDKDGSNEVELNKDNSCYLNIIGDYIYYQNEDHDNEIYKMSFDGSYNEPIY